MDDATIMLLGAASGIGAWILWRYLTRDPAQLDPGETALAPGVFYGPPAPTIGGLL